MYEPYQTEKLLSHSSQIPEPSNNSKKKTTKEIPAITPQISFIARIRGLTKIILQIRNIKSPAARGLIAIEMPSATPAKKS